MGHQLYYNLKIKVKKNNINKLYSYIKIGEYNEVK